MINANYAIDAGLDRFTTRLQLKAVKITPVPISLPCIAVTKKDIVALVNVLHSKEIQD